MFLLHTKEQKKDENQFATKSIGIKVIIIFKKMFQLAGTLLCLILGGVD